MYTSREPFPSIAVVSTKGKLGDCCRRHCFTSARHCSGLLFPKLPSLSALFRPPPEGAVACLIHVIIMLLYFTVTNAHGLQTLKLHRGVSFQHCGIADRDPACIPAIPHLITSSYHQSSKKHGFVETKPGCGQWSTPIPTPNPAETIDDVFNWSTSTTYTTTFQPLSNHPSFRHRLASHSSTPNTISHSCNDTVSQRSIPAIGRLGTHVQSVPPCIIVETGLDNEARVPGRVLWVDIKAAAHG